MPARENPPRHFPDDEVEQRRVIRVARERGRDKRRRERESGGGSSSSSGTRISPFLARKYRVWHTRRIIPTNNPRAEDRKTIGRLRALRYRTTKLKVVHYIPG